VAALARTITHCPNCGERVTPFAAGCALCGADLTAARRSQEQRREALPSLPSRVPRGYAADALLGVILIAVALFSPMIGAVFASLAAYKANQDGELARRNICLAALLISLALLILILASPGNYARLIFWLWS
jgi:hypothetical protein